MKRRPSLLAAGVALTLWLLVARAALAQSVTFTIDPTQASQPISPWIYGINPGLPNSGGVANPGLNQPVYANLNLASERLGGNRWTAYNWMTNASNAGSDYLYENDDYLTSSSTPGAAVAGVLGDAASRHAAALLTIPMAGYVSADESGPVNQNTPPAQSTHFVPSFPTASADPHPAANHVYQDQFVSWVKTNFPGGFTTGSTAPVFFMLDNEPDLWSSTHPEVHPAAVTYTELTQDGIAYAKAIKSVSSNAMVFGAANYGWLGFQTLQNSSDSSTLNNTINPATGQKYGTFLSYYLALMKAASQTNGSRLLDALDVHWYPEATGLNASGQQTRITSSDSSPGVVAARLQAPRSLWDPTYVETSWITQDSTNGQAIQLLPRIQSQINTNYAGTKLSISEYNYGGGTDISGGIAEADVLGIFGKQGVFYANEWPLASQEPFILGAMQMYRNYDGKGSAFGNTSISATTSDATNTSIYASTDSTTPGRMVLVALNKSASATAANIVLNNTGQNYTSFAVYQLTSASPETLNGALASPTYVNTYPISELSDFSLMGDSVSTIVPLVAAPAGATFDWNTTGSTATDWTAGVNWAPNGSPGFGLGDIARFGKTATIAAGKTVNLNRNQTIAQLINQNANAWTLAAGSPANSALVVNEITQSSAAGLTISAPITINSAGVLTFDGTGTGPVAVSNAISGGATQRLVKTSPGALTLSAANTFGGGVTVSAGSVEIDGPMTLTGGSQIQVTGGSLKLKPSAAASIGGGVTANIASGATLELAGTVSALSTGAAAANRVAITNSSRQSSGGMLYVSGKNQQVGAISGIGDTVIAAGGSLTADHIIQSALVIGGTAGNPGVFTIAPSGANGSPLDAPTFVTSQPPFGSGLSEPLSLVSSESAAPNVEAAGAASTPAVPEPSATLMVLSALGVYLVRRPLLSRRRERVGVPL